MTSTNIQLQERHAAPQLNTNITTTKSIQNIEWNATYWDSSREFNGDLLGNGIKRDVLIYEKEFIF